MKMIQEHYDFLEKSINDTGENTKDMMKKYKNYRLSMATFRWDLLWKANISQFINKTLYLYLKDDQIDTALRKITNTQ